MKLEQIAVNYFLTVLYMKKYRAQYKELLHMKLPGKRELTTIAEIINEISSDAHQGISPFQGNDGESWRAFVLKNLKDVATSEPSEVQKILQRFIRAAKAYNDLRKRRGILRQKLYWAGKRLSKEEK